MYLTNQQAIDARGGLRLIGSVDLDIEPAYIIAIQKRKLQPILEAITEVEESLTQKHGKRDESGQLLQSIVDGNKVTQLSDPLAFAADHAALMKQSQSIDAPVLKKSMLAGVKVKPDALFLMGPLFSET